MNEKIRIKLDLNSVVSKVIDAGSFHLRQTQWTLRSDFYQRISTDWRNLRMMKE